MLFLIRILYFIYKVMGKLSKPEERYHMMAVNQWQPFDQDVVNQMRETAASSWSILKPRAFKKKGYGIEYRNHFPKSIAKVFVEWEKEFYKPSLPKIITLQWEKEYSKNDIKRISRKMPKMLSGKWIDVVQKLITRDVESYNEIRNDLSIFAPNFLAVLIEKEMLPAHDVELDTDNDNSPEAVNDNQSDAWEIEEAA